MSTECLIHIWKALNVPDYPIKIAKQMVKENGMATRACTNERLIEAGRSVISQKTCLNDAVKLWNALPAVVTSCGTHMQIKKQAKIFAKTLPV